jgi:hypothetical protein
MTLHFNKINLKNDEKNLYPNCVDDPDGYDEHHNKITGAYFAAPRR